MKVKVLFFGNLSELIGDDHLMVENISTSYELLNELNSRYPLLKKHKYGIAVNQAMQTENATLMNDDEVALLPPFSGG